MSAIKTLTHKVPIAHYS